MIWIVLILGLVAVIALVSVGDKQKKLSDSLPRGPEVGKSLPTDMPTKEIKDLKQGPPQVTIYAYSSLGRLRLCPFCDGENDAEAAACRICGRQLN